MSEMIIAAYIFIFFLAAGLLFLACKLGILIKEVQNTVADKKARISNLRSELYFLENTVDCLKERVEILEDSTKKSKSKIVLGKIKVGK